MSSFCICKSYSHCFSKNTCEFDIVLTRTVNILTTNEFVKLKMLWTTRPWWTHGPRLWAYAKAQISLLIHVVWSSIYCPSTESLDTTECMNGEHRPGWHIAHAEDDLNLCMLCMFEGMFCLRRPIWDEIRCSSVTYVPIVVCSDYKMVMWAGSKYNIWSLH